MVDPQDSLRDGVKGDTAADPAGTTPILADTGARSREAMEELLRSGAADAAARRLAAHWRQERSPAAAHFVVSGFERLRPELALVDCHLAILRSVTLEPLIPLLRAAAFSAGLDLRARLFDYNVYVQEILDPESRLYTSRPDVVMLAVHTVDVAPQLWHAGGPSTGAPPANVVADVVEAFRSWIETFRRHSQAQLIVHNLEVPPVTPGGLLAAQSLDGQEDAIREINRQLRRIANEHAGVYVLDYDGLVAHHGRFHWTDERKWLTMRLPVAAPHLIHLCDEWMRFLHPLTGRIAKAVVVDLDNTLWGGVLGEEGVTGIQVGTDSAGAAYLEVQRALLDLRQRGILLAIASKNDGEEALAALAGHPDMLLRPEHFAAWRIGWGDKAQSVREIAAELNVGVDALAFLDDNPIERAQVAAALPELTIIDLPSDPLGYAHALRAAPAFERLRLSAEDLQRGQYYAAQKQRVDLQSASTSPEDFLRSLRQVVEIAPVTPMTLRRVAQLTQKTNQFNLTTRRYSEPEIAELAARSEMQVFAMKVEDVYADNGIVGMSILHYRGPACEIETLLLSCRVIGRTVETALLSFLCQQATQRGAARLRGWFLPTRKNAPAADFYARHGFRLARETDAGRLYELDLSDGAVVCPDWIRFREPTPLRTA